MNSFLLIGFGMYISVFIIFFLYCILIAALDSRNFNHFLNGDPTVHDNEDYYDIGVIAYLPLIILICAIWPLIAILYFYMTILDINAKWTKNKKPKKKKRK